MDPKFETLLFLIVGIVILAALAGLFFLASKIVEKRPTGFLGRFEAKCLRPLEFKIVGWCFLVGSVVFGTILTRFILQLLS